MILGIDPGASTGLARFEGGKLVGLQTIVPLDLYDYITGSGAKRVIFEDSRLQSKVWIPAPTAAAKLKVARDIGQIDAWCSLIVLACDRLGIAAHGISPKHKGAKVDAAEFRDLTGWQDSSNQHERDAAMVAWHYRRSR